MSTYNFQPATPDTFYRFEDGFEGYSYIELMLARPELFNETNNTKEKFCEKYSKVQVCYKVYKLDVNCKKAVNEGIEPVFNKCNKNNRKAVLFIGRKWCDENFWNQPEPVAEPPVVAPVIDVSVVEVLAETETVLEEEVVPPNVSIPEPDPIPPPTASNPNQKPPTKTFNGREYYSANELKEKYPEYFRGIRNKIRTIIDIKKIPPGECVYAMLVKKDLTWKLHPKTVKPACLFISKDWCDEKMFEKSTLSDEEVKVKSKYDIAPPVIEVLDEMMFKDINGEPILIEIRGNLINGRLDEDNLYFNADDTSKGFGMPNLCRVIIDDDRDGYIENEDYRKFYVKKSYDAKGSNASFCDVEIKVFLTYDGVIRFLNVSRHVNSRKFRKWATHILFTHQFGSKEQKQELASQLVGVSYSDYKMIFDTNASAFPCIYIIIIGLVSNLRKKYKISEKYPDNDLVLKFGKADDFKTRLPQHACRANYGPNIKVLHTQQIDVIHVKSAETALKDYFYGRILDIPTEKRVDKENDTEFISEGKKELFVMSDTKADNEWLQTILNRIGTNYAGRTKEFKHQLQLKDIENAHLKERVEDLKIQVNEKTKMIEYFQSK